MQDGSNSGENHIVRRVVLPSGKTIEVVYFEDSIVEGDEVQAQPSTTVALRDSMHICPKCSSQLVYPTEWEEAGSTHWEVSLRCPNCEWGTTGIFEQELVERFDEELDRGTERLVRDLKRLMHANMEDEIERFAYALEAGHVLPMDF